MRRRTLYAIATSAVGAVALVVSCGFPDVNFTGSDADGGGTDTSSSDSPVSGDGGRDADAASDTSTTPEAAPPIDATSEKPDAGACIDVCDCDKDTHMAKDAGCGGDDCDDTDLRAFPGQNFLKDFVTKDTKGDWNCNGTTERLIQNVNISCGGALDSCPTGRQGLRTDVPCGAIGQYVVCSPGALNVGCNETDGGVAQQECR